MRRAALVTFTIAVLVLAALVVVPFLTNKRTFPAEIMVPWPGIGGPVDKLPPQATLCIAGVTVERHSRVARLILTPYRHPGPRLDLTLTARGYRAQGSLPGGYRKRGVFTVPVAAPARDGIGSVCIHNAGRRRVGLYAYPSRLGTRPSATLDGQPLEVPPVFGLWESGRHSVADRLALTLDRVARFRGPLAHAWMVALALVLAGAGLIAGFALALRLSMPGSDGGRDSQPRSGVR